MLVENARLQFFNWYRPQTTVFTRLFHHFDPPHRQGKALEKAASKNVKILVVANPANTNCLPADDS